MKFAQNAYQTGHGPPSPPIPPTVLVGYSDATGFGLFARKKVRMGGFLFRFSGSVVSPPKASPRALQVGPDRFLESIAGFDDLLNHSCSPNCRIVFPDVALTALRGIEPLEELTFDYDTTEWDMEEQGCSFVCGCGRKSCRKLIRGFRHLAGEARKKVLRTAAPHVKEMAAEPCRRAQS